MNTFPLNRIAASLAVLLLTACSGGGGRSLVQPSTTPPDPPPSSPPSTPEPQLFDPCPAPVTSDCRVTLDVDQHEDLVTMQSDYALILRGEGSLGLFLDDYRFDGGTRVEGGRLIVGARLESDVLVMESGQLLVSSSPGGVLGSVESLGTVDLQAGTISGDVDSGGVFAVTGAVYFPVRIGGNFSQSETGLFRAILAPGDWTEPAYPLQIDGRADLAGDLELGLHYDSWGPYALPEARAHHLIHADGGVFGRFAQWTSPGLAITGELRYGANDVWFDLARISLQAAMASRGVSSALPLTSAANLDRALVVADSYALAPRGSLDEAQRQFLSSAAAIMWQRDTGQAIRSFDSLAGHAHAGLFDVLHQHGVQASARLGARLAGSGYATGALPWSDVSGAGGAGHGLAGAASGIDRWLSPRLLVGGSIGGGSASLAFDHLGGHGWGELPLMGFHAHYRGEGWHATGALGAGRARLQLQRPIELGAGGRHLAHSQRAFGYAFAHAELGRDVALGAGRLVPFVALDYSSARSDAFAEHGDTGLELVAASSQQSRLSGALGLRYAHDWHVGRHGLRLEIDARHRRDLVDGDPLHAAFRGVPGLWFELPDARARAAGEWRVGLEGRLGPYTSWSLDHARGFAGDRGDGGWSLGFRRAF